MELGLAGSRRHRRRRQPRDRPRRSWQAFLGEGARVVAVGPRRADALARVAAETGCDVVAADVSTLDGVRGRGGRRAASGRRHRRLVLCQTAAAEGGSEEEYAASFATDLMAARAAARGHARGTARTAARGLHHRLGARHDRRDAAPRVLDDEGRAARVDEERGRGAAGQGTRVNAVAPGAIDLPGGCWDRVRGDEPGRTTRGRSPAARRAAWAGPRRSRARGRLPVLAGGLVGQRGDGDSSTAASTRRSEGGAGAGRRHRAHLGLHGGAVPAAVEGHRRVRARALAGHDGHRAGAAAAAR